MQEQDAHDKAVAIKLFMRVLWKLALINERPMNQREAFMAYIHRKPLC